MDKTLRNVYCALRIALGGTAFVAGMDKFTHKLFDWDAYLSPGVSERLPIDGRNFMRLLGVIEMAVGVIVAGPRDELRCIVLPRPRLGLKLQNALLVGIFSRCFRNQHV
jgi:hypothetical protein